MAGPRGATLREMGEDGLLVTFGAGAALEPNAAANRLRASLKAEPVAGVQESSVSLQSVFLRFDPDTVSIEQLRKGIETRLSAEEWAGPVQSNSRVWRVPTLFGGDDGPQLPDLAAYIGRSEADLIAEISAAPLTVLTIGFAPGLPYLGWLGESFDMPRRPELSAFLPEGALGLAIRQIVVFPRPSKTGWSWIGRTSLLPFTPHTDMPFVLNPGDQVIFQPATASEFDAARAAFQAGQALAYAKGQA